MRRKSILVFLLVAFLLALASPALAQVPNAPQPANYCSGTDYDEDRCLTLFEGGGAFLSEWGVSLAISIVSIIVIVVWFIDRASLAIFELIAEGTWLIDLKTDFIEGVASFLPDVLRDTAFGDGGLMYLALILAGLLMTIPLFAQGVNRLAKPQRVMMWGVLLSVLFVSGTVGYDLIDMVENLRADMMQTTMGSDADYGVETLIVIPMHAQGNEADLDFGTLADLPNEFITRFFPEVEKIEVSIKTVESGFLGVVESEIESPESQAARIAGAVLAMFYALLGFFAGVIVFMTGISMVVLGVSALLLILFLFAALPLGFFEFGEIVLRNIVNRYVDIVVASLVIAIFVRVAAGMVSRLPGLDNVGDLIHWMLLMIVFYVGLRSLLKKSFGLLSASFGTFQSSIGSVWSGAAPVAGPSMADRVKKVAGGAMTGAMLMGGPQGALMGAAGAALSLPVMMRGGSGASANTTAGSEPPRGDVFANNGEAPIQQRAERPLGPADPWGLPGEVTRASAFSGASAASAAAVPSAQPETIISEHSAGASPGTAQAVLGVDEVFGAAPSPAPAPSSPADQAASASERARTMASNAKQQPFGPSDAATDAADTARTTGTNT